MANKDRQKRSERQARAREREALEAARAAAAPTTGKVAKAESRKEEKAIAKTEKVGLISTMRNYFRDVRTEMHRVVWPSKNELKEYSVAVTISLIAFGIAVWLVDTGFVGLLVAFTSLRG